MAQKAEIINEIEALTAHCRPPLMEATQRASWLSDWCADLGDFPIEAVRLACRKWRHSGSTKFPTPGQLLPMVRELVPSDRGPAVQVWRPATEDEYRAMSVRDKIREHQILAHQAYGKAGPQFRNGVAGVMSRAAGEHLIAADMPDSWLAWRREGQRHDAEAKRLREYLNQPARLAAG